MKVVVKSPCLPRFLGMAMCREELALGGLPAIPGGWEGGLSANTSTPGCFSLCSPWWKGISLEHQKHLLSVSV